VLHLLVVVAALAHFLTVAAFAVPAANGRAAAGPFTAARQPNADKETRTPHGLPAQSTQPQAGDNRS
jgi:hypothetical protein